MCVGSTTEHFLFMPFKVKLQHVIHCMYFDLPDEEETGELVKEDCVAMAATGDDSAGKSNRSVSQSQVSFCVRAEMFLFLR